MRESVDNVGQFLYELNENSKQQKKKKKNIYNYIDIIKNN